MEPLDYAMVDAIENSSSQDVKAWADPSTIAKTFRQAFDGSDSWVKEVISTGPNDGGPNVLVHQAINVQYIDQVKSSLVRGFQKVTLRGPLMGEALRGCKLTLTDAFLHADSVYRGAGQIIPMVERAFQGTMLSCSPTVCEPLQTLTIGVAQPEVDPTVALITKWRGWVDSQVGPNDDTELSTMTCSLPASEFSGFQKDLATTIEDASKVNINSAFYNPVNNGPWSEDDRAGAIVARMRAVNGLDPQVPDAKSFM